MKKSKKLAALLLAASFGLGILAGCSDGSGKLEERSDGLTDGFTLTAATDDVGRSFSPVSGYEQNKFVGIFYFLWNGSDQSEIKDVSNNYEKNHTVMSELLAREADGGTQEMNSFHYWGQPLYGYYNADDEWVIRKHIELFIHAGLDFIAFDTSNGRIYDSQVYTFLDILLDYYKQGYDVPKILFLTSVDPTTSQTSVQSLYYSVYSLYPEYEPLWFRGKQNKPWIIGSRTNDAMIDSYFYFKLPQWPNAAIESGRFPWMDWNYPQDIYTDPQVGNIMSVSVSQHVGISATSKPLADFSDSGLFAPENRAELQKNGFDYDANYMDLVYNANWGRGYDHTEGKNSRERALAEGTNFEQQWETVFKNEADGDGGNDVDLVFVTGWNEWIAQKQPNSSVLGDDYCHFVDTFNMEFSRDIEMCAEYLDNYYLSLIRNIREYKGEGEGKAFDAGDQLSLLMKGLDGWNGENVAVFRDFTGETIARNALDTSGQNVLENNTGRNDIVEVRAAADRDSVYLLIRTAEDITAHEEGDERWMNVYLGVEGAQGGWLGMQYVLNRAPEGNKTSLHRISGNSFTPAGMCDYSVKGNVMRIRISRSQLALPQGAFSLGIKVADNLQKDFDVAEFYVNGDAAPIGRMRYVYSVKG